MEAGKFITLLILVVVQPKAVLPQCQQATPILLTFYERTPGSNQITLGCRWCNYSNVEHPYLFINSTNMPVQFRRLENGMLEYNISQELEGLYYCGASPNNIGSNSVTLIGDGSYFFAVVAKYIASYNKYIQIMMSLLVSFWSCIIMVRVYSLQPTHNHVPAFPPNTLWRWDKPSQWIAP